MAAEIRVAMSRFMSRDERAVVDKETHLEMAGTASLSVSVLLISGLAVPAVLFLPLHISQHLHPDRSKLIDDRPNSSPEVQSP